MLAVQHIVPPTTFARIAILMERERKTRFSAGKLGYLWAYITPVVWIALIVTLFWVLQRTTPIHVPVEIFIATGILPYLVFRQTVTALSRTLTANRYLRYLRPVSNSDIMSATMLLEAFNMVTIAALIFGGISILFGSSLPVSPAGVLFSLALAWGIGCGVGRFVAAAGLLSDAFARSVPLLLRPLFWLSGIFYTATDLSQEIQSILWYSPFLHITELVRQSYFLGYTSPIASVWYPIAISALFFLASMPLEVFATRRRIMRGRL